MKIASVNLRPLVALVGWSSDGHHPTYYRLFCRALLELGCDVAALTPTPEAVKAFGQSLGVETTGPSCRLRCLPLAVPSIPPFRPSRWQWRLQAMLFASRVGRSVREMETAFGRPVDLLFFDCLYQYETHFVRRMVDSIQRPWAGLNIHARVLRDPTADGAHPASAFTLPDLLSHPRLQGVAVLDGAMAPTIERSIGKPVFTFPDIVDESRSPNQPIEQRLRRFAGNAKLVLSVGHLRPNKGVGSLCQVALDPAAQRYAFAFVGELPWSMYDSRERALVERAMTESPNSIFHCRSIPDGVAYNGIVNACDVLFAAYRNFPHSSATLTKAALLQKPLIVSEGHLMAERVREFRMGEIVASDSPELILGAIHRLLDDYPAWLATNQPRWDDYLKVNSYARLVEAFSKMLTRFQK